MFSRCFRTVAGETQSASAISALRRPSATRASTSRSRLDSPAAAPSTAVRSSSTMTSVAPPRSKWMTSGPDGPSMLSAVEAPPARAAVQRAPGQRARAAGRRIVEPAGEGGRQGGGPPIREVPVEEASRDRARHVDHPLRVGHEQAALSKVPLVLKDGARAVGDAAHGRGPMELDEMRLQQVQQHAVALVEVVSRVIEQKGLRVLDG